MLTDLVPPPPPVEVDGVSGSTEMGCPEQRKGRGGPRGIGRTATWDAAEAVEVYCVATADGWAETTAASGPHTCAGPGSAMIVVGRFGGRQAAGC